MTKSSELAEQFSNVINCRLCQNICVKNLLLDSDLNLPQPGYVGEDYLKSKVLLIGQNPGVSAPSQSHNDIRYNKALDNLKIPSNRAMTEMQSVLTQIIPSWPVAGKYFPLVDCQLELKDIAYFNLVRCRTKGNSPPNKRMTQMCVNSHVEDWLKFLKPRVVICIGKWSHDRISPKLDEIGIPHSYMNRMRSLSSEERKENKQRVVALVRKTMCFTSID